MSVPRQLLPLLRAARRGANFLLRPIGLQVSSTRTPGSAERWELVVGRLGAQVFEGEPGSFARWQDLLEHGESWLAGLARQHGLTLAEQHGALIARFAGVQLQVRSWEELEIAYEIFVNEEYSYHARGPSVVLDFGMNVGLASLYFASRPDVEKVYAFEPFLPTFRDGQANLALNPALAGKVLAHNIGLGAENATRVCPYDHGRKGCMGPAAEHAFNPDIEAAATERIEIQPASEHVRRVRAAHPQASLVVKMDVEGAEYEILDDLERSGTIDEIDAVLMEWHYRDPQSLIDRFVRRGFVVHVPGRGSAANGHLYAFRAARVSGLTPGKLG